MDSLTHTLLGATLGNALYRDKIGPRAPLFMALASNLPDLDAFVHLSGAPESVLLRRTFGHSAFTIPVWSAALAWLFYKRRPDLPFRSWWGLSALGCAVHVFFDLVNSFGVVPLWPFSDWRPELAAVFIVDLFLAAAFAATLVAGLIPATRPRLAVLSRCALAAGAAYVALCLGARSLAMARLSEEAARSAPGTEFVYVFPEPLGPHRWRGVVRERGIYRVYLIEPFRGRIEQRRTVATMPEDPGVRAARGSRLGRGLDWFFKAPVWTAGSSGAVTDVSVHDLRFSSLLLERRTPFSFRFRVARDGSVLPDG